MITAYRGEEGSEHLEDLMDWGHEVLFRIWDQIEEGNRPNCWIAGGAPLAILDGQEPKDIDIWFPDEENYDILAHQMVAFSGTLIKNTKSSTIYKLDGNNIIPNGQYELVKKYFPSAEETLEYFDFTVSSIAVGRDFVCYHEKFFEHLVTGKLDFNSLNLPTNSLRRIPKYAQKGFIPSDATLERLAERLSHVDMDDPNENVFIRIKENEDVYGNLPMSTKMKPWTAAPIQPGHVTFSGLVKVHSSGGAIQIGTPIKPLSTIDTSKVSKKKRKFFGGAFDPNSNLDGGY